MISSTPRLTEDGISFTVSVDYVNHDCLVSKEALAKISRLSGTETDFMDVFKAFEARINGVARRMVTAGVKGTPMLLSDRHFALPGQAS